MCNMPLQSVYVTKLPFQLAFEKKKKNLFVCKQKKTQPKIVYQYISNHSFIKRGLIYLSKLKISMIDFLNVLNVSNSQLVFINV